MHDAAKSDPKGKSSLLSRGMIALLSAQFLSALADNALFVAALAALKASGEQGMDAWLQGSFVLAYILLAPFVGPFADALPKGRVMMIANLVKFSGAALMLSGGHPVIGYLIAGIGAAGYSPAKYGILSQMHEPEKLVRANGMIEGSTIAAVLLGAGLGGMLSDISPMVAIGAVVAAYVAAAGANLLIPRLAPEHPEAFRGAAALFAEFWESLRTLWGNADARFAIVGTSAFWGVGASLRLLLFLWAPAALGISSNGDISLLMGCVSIGVVAGAGLASWLIPLSRPNRTLLGALLIGPAVLLLTQAGSFWQAASVLVFLGACGGLFVVPLNALLQERAHETVGAGHGLAIQNFFENLFILAFVGLYHLLAGSGLSPEGIAVGFGWIALASLTLVAAGRMALERARASAAKSGP